MAVSQEVFKYPEGDDGAARDYIAPAERSLTWSSLRRTRLGQTRSLLPELIEEAHQLGSTREILGG
jgi:hypothetical protein